MLRLRSYLLAVALLGLFTLSAPARVAAPAPIADRVARADTVVLGKVTSIEEKGVTVDGAEYKIAVVQVKEALKGGKGQTHLRVAFMPMARFPANSLQKDLDVLLFLSPAKGEPFFTTQMYYDVVNMNSPMWAKEVEATQQCARVAASAEKYLKEGKPAEKLLAAAMLILQYRNTNNTSGKQEAIDPAQSKAILLALTEADWAKTDPDGPLGILNGQTLFFRLGVTPADGWTPPKDFSMLAIEAKKWLKENADKFVIKKFLPAEG